MKIFIANIPWQLNKGESGVRAGSRWAHKRDKKRGIYYYPFPFFLAYTTAVLEREGYDVFLKDYLTLELKKEDLFEDIKKFKPDLFVAEISTPSFYSDIEICKEVKNRFNCEIVLCGPHVTVFTKETMKKYPFVDYVLIGEYDYTLKELVEKKSNKKLINKIKGLAYRRGNNIIVNERRPLIENLDELPFPTRHFLPMERYNDSFCRGYPNIQMISSRGCPYRCIFCLEPNVVYGKSGHRARSSKNVVDEMELVIKKYKLKEIYFDDATFTFGKQRVLDLCREIKKRNLGINWSCMGDTINLDEEMIKEMSSSRCVGIKFGVESANKKILKNIDKYIDLEKTKKVVNLCKKYKIKTHATYMFGLPGETEETMKQTLDYAIELNSDTAQFAIAVPFPGTPFYELAEREGWLRGENWGLFDGNQSSAISHPNLSQKKLFDFLCYAQKKYQKKIARNPREVYYFLRMNYRINGLSGLIKVILQKISWFLGG